MLLFFVSTTFKLGQKNVKKNVGFLEDFGILLSKFTDLNEGENLILYCLIQVLTVFLGGVTALLAIKYDELLVGSGDGTVCIVVDQTTKPSNFKKPTHDGVPKTVSEPTKPCLREVYIFLAFFSF